MVSTVQGGTAAPRSLGGEGLIEQNKDLEEMGKLHLGREEDMFLVTEKVDDGVVCIEG